MLLANFFIMMTIPLMMRSFKELTIFGGPILLTDLLVPIMLGYQDLTRDFFRMVVKQSMHSPKTGGTIIIGFVPQCVC